MSDPLADDEKPLDPAAASIVARVRWLMLISGATTFIGVAAILGVIGYRVFKSEGSAAQADATALLPKGARIAMLFNADSPINARYLKTIQEAARPLDVPLIPFGVRRMEDFAPAFARMKRERAAGLVVLGEPLFGSHRRRLADLALQSGLASSWPIRAYAEAGGLVSYGANMPDLWRRATSYVAKILQGAKAAELPMEQPTKFELIINLTTAKTLSLTIPPPLLLRADQVIE